jgi:hypothetical protein
MPPIGRPSLLKRQKEADRLQKQKEKAEQRAQRKLERANRPESEGDEDPDIAGIVPGPQPIPED